jgi:hypothetical protein
VGAERLAVVLRRIERQASEGITNASLATSVKAEFARFAIAVDERLTALAPTAGADANSVALLNEMTE